ncbi:DUF3732 domain-containing protein [Mailhella massiliensis]|uniref:DUF3732 domain-containing protein n=1 Tax=Mailhella massiliensis TaxID=1903261 RepID=UPI0009FB2BB5|nr:DUF3732 domain-containing protein [Mailhella massiliensis]
MMQIRELVLYGHNGKVRHLTFSLGSINIISGRSKSGKSIVGDIIDYCLGKETCNIAEGVVREKVAWYGILLQFSNDRVFVARKNPDPGHQTTSLCYIEIGTKLEVPPVCNFAPNINVDGVIQILSNRLGIAENLHTPTEGQSRDALTANIRHALFYCFQSQEEIAAKNNLFHNQSEDFITQAIKDTLPYFLGAIDDESLSLSKERSRLMRQLTLKKQKLKENELLSGGSERAIKLLGEAVKVGLIENTESVNYSDYKAMHSLLKNTTNWIPLDVSASGMDRLSMLQSKLAQANDELDEIRLNISEAKLYSGETNDFTTEALHQKIRLESIGLFKSLDFDPERCPLCSGRLNSPLPSVEAMKKSILDLDNAISNVTKEQPKLRSYIDSLEHEYQNKRELIRGLKSEIDGLYEQQDAAQKIRDLNSRRAKVVGRISLWLESVKNDFDSELQLQLIKNLENRIQAIEEQLSAELIEERKQSALSRIQVDMTNWAKKLELEYSNSPYRLDLKKVTVVVDKPERPVPLKQLGSGSNWVGVHLITYFALHKYFIEGKRPVPNFLFIDQPSQVYFPSETDELRTDWKEVDKMYQFIFDRVQELKGELQVIIVDHAALDNETFREKTIESWLSNDNSLIPNDWFIE